MVKTDVSCTDAVFEQSCFRGALERVSGVILTVRGHLGCCLEDSELSWGIPVSCAPGRSRRECHGGRGGKSRWGTRDT